MGQNTPFKKVLPWVAFLGLMFFMNYTGRSMLGPLLVYVEQDLGIGHSQSTGLLLYLSAGFSVCLIFTGFVPAKIKPRLVVGISCAGMGASLVAIAHCYSLFALGVSMTVCGIFAGLYFTSAMASMSSVVSRSDWGRAIAVHELGPALSMLCAPLVAQTGIILTGSWRGSVQLWGLVSLAVAAAWFIFVRQGEQKSDPPSFRGVKNFAGQPLVWFFCWCFAFGIAGEMAPYSVMSLHLTSDRGLGAENANFLLSASRIAAPFAVLLGGSLAPRLGTLKTLRLFFLLHGICLVGMGMPLLTVAAPAMFMQAVMSAAVWPALLSILPEKFPIRMHPTILSMTMPVAVYFGTGIAPKLLGVIGERLNFSTGFIMMGIISLLTIPACSVLKKGSYPE